jgi:FkbM family methyltransferase
VSEFIPLDQVQWKTVRMLQRPDETFEYEFELPVPLADWDVFAVWERARFHSMRDHLNKGDVLFDVGTEQGWCNLIYAQFVGPENMVLIEPTQEFWPNIKATWERNFGDVGPKGTIATLLSDKNVGRLPRLRKAVDWPSGADGPLIDRNKYQYVHEHSDGIREMTLDTLVARSHVVPDAITMDVEGAEILVVRGAAETLREHHPKVWISIHDDLGERDYGTRPGDVLELMESLGYTGQWLGTDHESHWRFY